MPDGAFVRVVRVRALEKLAEGEIDDRIWYAAMDSDEHAIDAVRRASESGEDCDVSVVGHLRSVSRHQLDMESGEVKPADAA